MQGCVVVSNKFATEKTEHLEVFLSEYKASIEYVNANQAEAASMIVALEILALPAPVAEAAINGSKIAYIDGDSMRASLVKLYEVLYDADPTSIGGKKPDENIFYKK